MVLQDYNTEVLQELTMPNVSSNLEVAASFADKSYGTVRYFAGDWVNLYDLLEKHTFDLIITADTVYSVPSLPKLYEIIKYVRIAVKLGRHPPKLGV